MHRVGRSVFVDCIDLRIWDGLTLMTTIAPESLCRYLELDGESVVLRDADRFSIPLSAERVLVESAKSEPMWQGLNVRKRHPFPIIFHSKFEVTIKPCRILVIGVDTRSHTMEADAIQIYCLLDFKTIRVSIGVLSQGVIPPPNFYWNSRYTI